MTAPFGAYLHIPFCSRRCDYCAFATWSDRHHLQDAYLDALSAEIAREVERGLPVASSVFVGGGTPSLVDPVRLAHIVSSIPVTAGAEITIECNPESVTDAHIASYVGAGVDRLSFGVQSLSAEVLVSLGRDHNPDTVTQAVALARAGGIKRFVTRKMMTKLTSISSLTLFSPLRASSITRSPIGRSLDRNALTTSYIGDKATTEVLVALPIPTKTAGAGGTCELPIDISNWSLPMIPLKLRQKSWMRHVSE